MFWLKKRPSFSCFRMLGFEGRAVVHSEAAFNPGKVTSALQLLGNTNSIKK